MLAYAVFRGGPHDGLSRPIAVLCERYWFAESNARYVRTVETTPVDGIPHHVYAYAPGDESDTPPATGQWAEQPTGGPACA